MKRNWMVRAVKFVVFAALIITVMSLVVMRLWNWLTPVIFGGHVINFWQAAGLLILSKILFGGFRGRPGRHWYRRHRMMERWEQMTPEERKKIRQAVRGGCGSGWPAPEPKA